MSFARNNHVGNIERLARRIIEGDTEAGAVTGYHDLPDHFTKQYVETALWSSHDKFGPLDDRFGPEHIDQTTMRTMLDDCARFQQENAVDIDGEDEQAGHDFWLTRNGHGAGFWDGDWPEPAATRLTSASHAFGELDLIIDDEHYDDDERRRLDDDDDDDDGDDDDDDDDDVDGGGTPSGHIIRERSVERTPDLNWPDITNPQPHQQLVARPMWKIRRIIARSGS